MKKLMVLTLTLVLIAAMAVTTTNAQEDAAVAAFSVQSRPLTEELDVENGWWIEGIVFVNKTDLAVITDIGAEAYLEVWDVTTATRDWIRTLPNGATGGIAHPSKGEWIAYAVESDDNELETEIRMRYINVRQGALREVDWRGQPPWPSSVTCLAFKPNSHLLASGNANKTVHLWELDFNDSRSRGTLQGHAGPVRSLAWHPESYTLASASSDGQVILWNTPNLAIINVLNHPDNNGVYSVAWSPNGNTLVSITGDGGIHFWAVSNPGSVTYVHSLWEHLVHDDRHLFRTPAVAFSPDGETLVSATSEETLFWNPNTFALRHRSNYGATKLAFSPDGRYLAGTQHTRTVTNVILHRLTVDGEDTDVGDDDGEMTTEDDDEGDDTDGEETGADSPGVGDIEILIATLGITIADVNGNGIINRVDLSIVAENYGLPYEAEDGVAHIEDPAADINKDGKVDVTDILIMIVAIDAAEAIGAPALTPAAIKTSSLQAADVRQWLHDAKAANADPAGIAALERLLTELNRRNLPVPKETVLLANYPNPFNPETWIPYQLAEPAEVKVSIYSADGKLVRTLDLGQVPAGIYQNRSRAAYWDGRNAQGESVASGVYFYTLSAGDFSATRKMVIRK